MFCSSVCWNNMSQSSYNLVRRVQVLRSNVREREEMAFIKVRMFVQFARVFPPVSVTFLQWILQMRCQSVCFYRLSFAIFVVLPCSFFSICFPGTLQLQRLCWKIRQEANPPFRNRKARGTCTHALSGYSLNSRHFVFLVFFFIAIYVHDTFLSKSSTEFQTWDSQLQNSDLAPEPPSCVPKPYTPLL